MIPLANLLVAPTAASVLATAVSAFTSLGIPAGSWNKRGVAYGGLVAVSSLFASVIGQLVTSVLTAPFLPLAVPPFNAILAQFVYGVIPNVATYATGLVTLTNPTGSIWNKAARTVIFGNSLTQETYTNTVPFSLGANASISGIAVEATTIGSVGSAVAGPGPGSIDTVITPMLGVTVTNPAPVVGLDGDSPATVKAKCLASIAARSYKGTQGAYEYAVATATNGGNPVNVNRWSVVSNPSTGAVTAYLAAPGGAPTVGDVAAVQAAIVAVAQPQGITAAAVACTVVPLSATPRTVTVYATTGVAATPASIAAALDTALEEWPISGRSTGGGGFVFAAWLNGKIAEVDPAIFDVTGFVDVALSAGQVAELTSATTILLQVSSS